MTPPVLARIERLKSAVAEPVPFEVTLPSGEVKTYKLILDYNAIHKASEATGRKLFDRTAWQDLGPENITTVFWASFDHYHPEVTLAEARSFLGPAQIETEVYWMLVENCFPGTIEMVNKQLAGKNGTGETGPNLPGPS